MRIFPIGSGLCVFDQFFYHWYGQKIIFPQGLDDANLINIALIVVGSIFSGFTGFAQNAFPDIIMNGFFETPVILTSSLIFIFIPSADSHIPAANHNVRKFYFCPYHLLLIIFIDKYQVY